MRSYELMVIHRPEMAEADVRASVSELETAIAESGSVGGSDFWGKRRFAFEIEHMREGYYSVVDFNGDNELIQRLDRALSLSDLVVRHKIVRSGKH